VDPNDPLLRFPDRAAFIQQSRFDDYRVRLDHWKELSSSFLAAFKAVHDRRSAAVLLVHGAQGTGKTLFSLQLEKGFQRAREGLVATDGDNLWHTLVADRPDATSIIREATDHTDLRRVLPESGWLAKERQFAKDDKHQVRLFVIDDVHKDVFLREWAELDQAEVQRASPYLSAVPPLEGDLK
jgi:primosomal protein N'